MPERYETIIRWVAQAHIGEAIPYQKLEVVGALERVGFHTPAGAALGDGWARAATAHAQAYLERYGA